MKKRARAKRTPHWLVRPRTVRRLWAVFVVVLVATVVPDLFMRSHGHFGIDATLGFFAWYGFLTCLVMIVLAKVLGKALKRRDTYYDE